MFRLEETQKAAGLFAESQESMVWSCLDRTMGDIYVEDEEEPQGAAACLGDFCFLAGKADVKLLKDVQKERPEISLFVPPNEEWAALIEKTCGAAAKRFTRYAILKEENVWDLDYLENIVRNLPEGFELKLLDEPVYDYAKKNPWAKDWVSQFPTYEDFEKNGLGAVIVKDGIPVAAASSYSAYKKGIEVQIDTHLDYRRRGLALVCGAKLILECQKRGLYPSWDAHNLKSAALAEKLGYHRGREYIAYALTGVDTRWPQIYPKDREPDIETIGAYVGSPYWEALRRFIEETYRLNPSIQYSSCSMAPGWNVKYKKGGRALCTIYANQGFFTCLICIGQKEAAEAKALLPMADPYVKRLYENTSVGNGTKWMMIDVTSESIEKTVEDLLLVRIKPPKNKSI